MANMMDSLYNMRLLDDLAGKDTYLHRVHPLSKLLVTAAYLAAVVSFDRYETTRLLPFLFYPVFVFTLAELPLAPLAKRILLVEPLIIGIGILNPFFDREVVMFGGVALARGWVAFLSIFIKCGLTVTAALLLIATTGMEKLGAGLRKLKIPRLFVLQLLLTYRYISVLVEEAARMTRAYLLRAPGQKGVQLHTWGSFAGQLILRTYDRSQSVYQAMCLRGFTGEYPAGGSRRFGAGDGVFLVGWLLFFSIVRVFDLPLWIGTVMMGGK